MLRGKVVVITGASSGLGAEMATLCAGHGAIVVLTARSLQKMKEIARQIETEHAIYEMDVTSTEQVFQTMELIITRFGHIDILINNAGFAIFESFDKCSLQDYEEMMDVNYMGVVRCTKAVIPSMLARGSGHIINIASISGKIGSAKTTGYAASKHAVLGFTNSLRHELLAKGSRVFVSAVNPGPIQTPFFRRADPSGKYLSNIPKWFILQPRQVADAVLDVIGRKRAEINIPRVSGIGAKLLQLLPRSLDKWLYRLTDRK